MLSIASLTLKLRAFPVSIVAKTSLLEFLTDAIIKRFFRDFAVVWRNSGKAGEFV